MDRNGRGAMGLEQADEAVPGECNEDAQPGEEPDRRFVASHSGVPADDEAVAQAGHGRFEAPLETPSRLDEGRGLLLLGVLSAVPLGGLADQFLEALAARGRQRGRRDAGFAAGVLHRLGGGPAPDQFEELGV